MKFYTQTHKHYCGIDLHARNLYVCILDHSGETCVHKNSKARPDALIKLITPHLEDLVIRVECTEKVEWRAGSRLPYTLPVLLCVLEYKT